MKREQAAKIIQHLNFDFVEISGGIPDPRCRYATVRPEQDKHYYQHVFRHFKKLNLHKKQPIIITGGYHSAEDSQLAFDEGAELVGFARLFLEDKMFLFKAE